MVLENRKWFHLRFRDRYKILPTNTCTLLRTTCRIASFNKLLSIDHRRLLISLRYYSIHMCMYAVMMFFLLIDHLGSLFDVSWEDPEEAWSITRDTILTTVHSCRKYSRQKSRASPLAHDRDHGHHRPEEGSTT